MAVPGQNHRDAWFAPFYKKILHDCKYLFQTEKATPIIFPGVTPTCLHRAPCTRSMGAGHQVPLACRALCCPA